jgi:hypothetical protein
LKLYNVINFASKIEFSIEIMPRRLIHEQVFAGTIRVGCIEQGQKRCRFVYKAVALVPSIRDAE